MGRRWRKRAKVKGVIVEWGSEIENEEETRKRTKRPNQVYFHNEI